MDNSSQNLTSGYSTGRRLLLAGAITVIVLQLTLGEQNFLAIFALNTLAGTLASVFSNYRRSAQAQSPWRNAFIRLVHGLALAVVVALLHLDHWLAMLLPILAQVALAWLVIRTLRPGQMPAIRRIAAAMQRSNQPLPGDIDHYTRSVTWLWAATFMLLAVINAWMLNLHGQAQTTSLTCYAVDAVVIISVIVIEFLYRKQRYASYNMGSLLEFCKGLRRLDPLGILLT